MFKSILYIFLLSIFSLSVSCNKEKPTETSGQSHELFRRIVNLYQIFNDSLNKTENINTLDEIIDEFDNHITKLIYEFPPDTDLLLSEQENDSIMKLADEFLKIKKEKRANFLSSNYNTIDSVSDL